MTYVLKLIKLPFALDRVRQTKSKVVYDIGCGSGYGSYLLSYAHDNIQVIGLDIEPEVVTYAQKVFGNTKTFFSVGDAYKIPARDNSLDMVVCFEVLEHIDNPERAITGFRRLIRRGGHLIFSMPINHPDVIYHKKIYSLEEAKSLIESVRWSKINYFCQNPDNPFVSKIEKDCKISTLVGICEK